MKNSSRELYPLFIIFKQKTHMLNNLLIVIAFCHKNLINERILFRFK